MISTATGLGDDYTPAERPFLPQSQDDMWSYVDLIREDNAAYIVEQSSRWNALELYSVVLYRNNTIEGVGIMKYRVRITTAAAAITVSSLVGSVEPAQAYQIDCAILLCLAGGWPSSAPCAAAFTEFVRRITPFPIEPPLQIWRCPMAVSLQGRSDAARERLFAIADRGTYPPSLIPAQSVGRADIDISTPPFDFVRSIRVFHIEYSQVEGRENCIRSDATRLGTYGAQGDYSWRRSRVADVPAAAELRIPTSCNPYAYRAVFVDWRDQRGNYGFEEIHY